MSTTETTPTTETTETTTPETTPTEVVATTETTETTEPIETTEEATETEVDIMGEIVTKETVDKTPAAQPLEVVSTPKIKVAAFKQHLNIEDDELDEETLASTVKKLSEDATYFKQALLAKDEYENSEEYKSVVAFIELDNDKKFLAAKIDDYIRSGYSEFDAKQMAEDELAKLDETQITREGARLNNLAKSHIQQKRKEFLDKAIEAKSKIQTASPAYNFKEVEDILATSDTILGIDLKTSKPEKRKEFMSKPLELIKSGKAKELLSDPKMVAEFLAFHANKDTYDKRMKNIGANELRTQAPKRPTVTVASGNNAAKPTETTKKLTVNDYSTNGF